MSEIQVEFYCTVCQESRTSEEAIPASSQPGRIRVFCKSCGAYSWVYRVRLWSRLTGIKVEVRT